MQQTKLSSFIESIVNIIVGFGINYLLNLLVFPIFNLHISLKDNFYLGLIFTVASVIRSYTLRRWFNKHLHDVSEVVAQKWTEFNEAFHALLRNKL